MKKLRNVIIIGMTLLLTGCKWMVLNPKGEVAAREASLLIDSTLLMLIVVVPVIVLSLIFAFHFRAKNKKAKYSPGWYHSYTLETICWGVPLIIIAILATWTWVWSHRLDPYRSLQSDQKPLTIQVVALDWRWLFIYPQQGVATVNYMPIPTHRPIRLLVSADAPMNSIQIPQLTGQIYAMPGMRTQLHFNALEPGKYYGFSANYSGDGFSGMNFFVDATDAKQFDHWVRQAKRSPQRLSLAVYDKLMKPSQDHQQITYSGVEDGLFNFIIMKYMSPTANIKKIGNKPLNQLMGN